MSDKYEEVKCDSCSGTTRGDTCPILVKCSTCQAEPKAKCKNPSGHTYNSGSGNSIHSSRFITAQAIDDNNGFNWKEAFNVQG